MLRPLAVQLYSLRQYAEKDFVSVLKRVAEIGYKGVEPAGFWNLSPVEFKKIINDLGLEMYSSHTPWARKPDDLNEIIDTLGILGLKNCVCGYSTPDFQDMDAIKRTAENTNKMQEILEKAGIELFQHNHYWEFERIDGRLKYEIYAELCPKVKFEIDSFWSTNKGTEDPVAIMKQFGSRVNLIHMKDGVCTQKTENAGMVNGLLDMKIDLMPLGTGTLPIKEIVAAAPDTAKTIIVELDYCSTDMWQAIEQSYRFMTSSGLAAGRK